MFLLHNCVSHLRGGILQFSFFSAGVVFQSSGLKYAIVRVGHYIQSFRTTFIEKAGDNTFGIGESEKDKHGLSVKKAVKARLCRLSTACRLIVSQLEKFCRFIYPSLVLHCRHTNARQKDGPHAH